jgi:hypothetical protein
MRKGEEMGIKIGYAIGDVDKDEMHVWCDEMDDLYAYAEFGDEDANEIAERCGVQVTDLLGTWFFEVNYRMYFMKPEGIDHSTVKTLVEYISEQPGGEIFGD